MMNFSWSIASFAMSMQCEFFQTLLAHTFQCMFRSRVACLVSACFAGALVLWLSYALKTRVIPFPFSHKSIITMLATNITGDFRKHEPDNDPKRTDIFQIQLNRWLRNPFDTRKCFLDSDMPNLATDFRVVVQTTPADPLSVKGGFLYQRLCCLDRCSCQHMLVSPGSPPLGWESRNALSISSPWK